MPHIRIWPLLILSALACFLNSSCSQVPVDHRGRPQKILWAWERPEDLRSIDTKKVGVAFLVQTLQLKNDGVVLVPRRQPLEIAPETYLIAVTRIETAMGSEKVSSLSVEQRGKIVEYLKKTVELPRVVEVQIDFDASLSERPFYKDLIFATRTAIDSNVPVTITALASWCSSDRWLDGLPIDDAIPMLFDIGNDESGVRGSIANGEDWNEPKCRKSYGVSINSHPIEGMKKDRTIYYFKSSPWTEDDFTKIEKQ